MASRASKMMEEGLRDVEENSPRLHVLSTQHLPFAAIRRATSSLPGSFEEGSGDPRKNERTLGMSVKSIWEEEREERESASFKEKSEERERDPTLIGT